MELLSVIKDFNITEYCLPSLSSGLIALMMNQLCFQGMKEAFRNGIIPTVALTTDALLDAMLL